MIDHEYPRFEELDIAPDFLLIGANAIHNLHTVTAPLATDRSQKRKHVRHYGSIYAGVRAIQGRWIGCWGTQGHLQGPRRPMTRDGEIAAAWDRAKALGRDWLEMRH